MTSATDDERREIEVERWRNKYNATQVTLTLPIPISLKTKHKQDSVPLSNVDTNTIHIGGGSYSRGTARITL